MICQACKSSNSEGARFCSHCGADLTVPGASSVELISEVEEITQLRAGPRDEARLIRPGRNGVGATIAAKYRIDAKLGAGGMGEVYRVTRLLIGDEVAIKILHSDNSDPKAAERFRREAQAAARLKHPNAVSIYDFGVTDDGLQYLVMELVEGENLRLIIKQQGPLTPSASAEIITQICGALDEAHRQNIVHRDIKPDNIMVNLTAGGLRVKVLDFGIAKLRNDIAGNLTQTGSILGTPHYMSPEQCLGEELDSRSDIYSLGVVLYEMLTGTVPFNSPTPAAVVVQHVNQSPAPPHILNASIPRAVEAAVLHALEKRRENRPQSAGDLARELTNAIKSPGSPSLGAAEYSAAQVVLTPTLHVNQQSFSAGFPTSRSVERDTIGPNARPNTTRVVLLTVVATVVLLVVGGLGAQMLLNRSNQSTNSTADVPNARKDESGTVNQSPNVATQLPSPALTRQVDVPPVNTSALRNEVLETLEGWAAAARAHDLDAQMSYYSATINPYFLKRNVSSDYVRTNRSLAFSRYYKLDVTLSNITIEFDSTGTQATATFDKAYSFEGEKHLSGSVKSMLWLTKSEPRWLITGEKDLKVYFVNKY